MSPIALSALLPSKAFLLLYAIPLFLLSLVLVFAGAFLTLDRTRSFVPINDPFAVADNPKANRLTPFFRGGVGGIIAGYAFGLHLSTFFALLIPSLSGVNPLAPGSFLAVWLLSCLSIAVVAGRWKYVAFASAGITGGSTLALSLSVILHPSLVTRVIFVAVFFPIFAIFTLLPLHRFQSVFIRTAMSATGSFGVIFSIALMADINAWSSVWERLWVSNSLSWGSAQEKGLSAGFCLFFSAGIACDWFLRRRFGENPDEKWDSYLAEYVANLPNVPGRAGSFQPLTSIWTRFFGHQKSSLPYTSGTVFDENIIPSEKTSSKEALSPPEAFRYEEPAFFRKAKKGFPFPQKQKKSRELVKFQPSNPDDLSSSDSDSDDDGAKPRTPLSSPMTDQVRPWLPNRPRMNSISSDSPTTLVGDDSSAIRIDRVNEFVKIGKKDNNSLPAQRYNVATTEGSVPHNSQGWTPPFIRQYLEAHRQHVEAHSRSSANESNSSKGRSSTGIPPGAVPMTPSLINALDRIAVAQDQVYGGPERHSGPSTHDGLPPSGRDYQGKYDGPKWDVFWRDVQDKARQ